MKRQATFATSVVAILAIALLGSVAVWGAQDAPPNPGQDGDQQDGRQVSAEQIQNWIEQLDADDFQTREDASESLLAAGVAAVEPVAAAAEKSDSLEVITRSLDVLTRLYESEEGDDQAVVKSALQRLAASDNKAAAGRADAVLNPPQPQQPVVPQPLGGFNIVMGGGNMQIQTTTDANGNKTIKAQENGKDVNIEEKADGSIKMTVKETVNGKEETQEYAAKDKDELKEKHEDAFKLYDKYSQRMNAFQIRPAQIMGRLQALPVAPAIRLFNPLQQQAALNAIQEAEKEIKQTTEAIRALAEGDESKITTEALHELLKQIEAAEKKISEASKQMGG